MITLNDNIIPPQSAATITTAAVLAHKYMYCSAQITSTGAGAGTLQLQGSNDYFVAAPFAPVNWSNIGTSVSVSGAGVFLIPVFQICYQSIRAVYTNTGTGTISVVFQAQGA
jgi:hypothetical protein